jgi:hypothetical protein
MKAFFREPRTGGTPSHTPKKLARTRVFGVLAQTMANLTEGELSRLELVRTEDEWGAACRSIKTAHEGRYPDDWFHKVIQSGLLNRVLARFGQKPGVYVSTLGPDGTAENTTFIENKVEN